MTIRSPLDSEVVGVAIPRWMALAYRAAALRRSTPEQRVSLSDVLREALAEYVERHPEMQAEASPAPCDAPAQ